MTKRFEYKGYKASIDYSAEDGLLVGKIADINALIMFSGESLGEMEAEFRGAVDEYIAYCQEAKLQPEKPYSGTFNVRVGADLHRKAALVARQRHVSLNEFVRSCLEANVGSPTLGPVVVEATSSASTSQGWGNRKGEQTLAVEPSYAHTPGHC